MNLRKEAASRLAAKILTAVPSLGASAVISQAEPEVDGKYPGLVIMVGKFRFLPNQDEDVHQPAADKEFVQVGEAHGDLEVRIYAKAPAERNKLEDQVEQVFLARSGSPGVLVDTIPNVEIGGVASAFAPTIAFRLETLEWNEEFAFDRRRYSFISVATELPVLAVRTVVNLNDLRLGLTEDLTTAYASLPAGSVEVVKINADGSLTKSVQP